MFFISFHITIFSQQAKTGTLQFIQNNGQWNNNVLMKADVQGGALFLEENGFTWHFTNIAELTEHTHGITKNNNKILRGHAFKTTFLNANSNAQMQGEEKFENFYNYFVGKDRTKWQGKVPAFAKAKYINLYKQVDAIMYSEGKSLKYDLIVKPGADVSQIQIRYTGLQDIKLVNGNLELTTSVNKIIELHPYAYQMYGSYSLPVACNFKLEGNILSFEFPDGYDVNTELIIDPATLIFASYSGSTSDNWGYTATYDEDGNLYGGGIVFGTGYPTTVGAYQEEFGGGDYGGAGLYSEGCDIGLSKFSSDGTSLLYSTFLGGGSEDLPHSMIVNNAGELVIYGTTGSDDFPMGTSAFDDSFNGGDDVSVDNVIAFPEGVDIFVAILSEDGASLTGSTFIGGSENDGFNLADDTEKNYGDFARGEVIVDDEDNILIASSTYSTNFPVTSGVFQDSNNGDQDGVICKLNADASSLIWSSYIGGAASDGAYSIKKDNTGYFIAGGGTSSSDFPVTSGVWKTTYQGGTTDGWVAKIESDGSTVSACSYVGTNQYDQTYFVETDDADNIYITGQTAGAYPVINALYSESGSSQYITKLTSDLTTVVYSTVFGSGSSTVNISPSAFLVDTCENVYVSGWGGSVNATYFPGTGYTTGMTVTSDAEQPTTDGSDFYFIVFQKDADALIYATFFGGDVISEHVDGGTSRFDKEGRIYQSVCAGCGGSDDFPVTDDAYSETNGSTNCNLGVVKFEFNFIGPDANISGSPLSGCAPLTIDFTNSSMDAVTYNWDFGDGTTSTESTPTHTFTEPGTYTVNFTAIDEDACDPEDEAILTVNVYGFPEADFTYTPNPANIYTVVDYTDASTDAVSWNWDFGDGASSTVQNPSHQYTLPGTYTVCLKVENANGCEDTVCYPIEVIAFSVLDAPNAFTPNGDGVNDTYVAPSYGLTSYELEIYNRWGELVFQTNSPAVQWDGYFNDKEQEMGTYVFIMRGTGEDGQNFYKQGNITLVR